MNRRNLLHWTLYVLALALTTVMVLPSITSAQDIGGARQDKQGSLQANSGWKQDGPNVYIEGGSVGIGARPSDLGAAVNPNGDAALLLKTPNDMKSGIYLREHNMNYGFDITYDGSVVNPNNQSSSGLFGIWRLNDPAYGRQPVITAYRHNGSVGIGTTPNEYGNVRLQVFGNQLIQGLPLPPPAGQGWKPFDDNGEEAYLYLGDTYNYVKANYGIGLQLGTWQGDNAVTIQQGSGNVQFANRVGIGTAGEQPRAKLEIAGQSGVEGLHLSLKEDQAPYSGTGSPMIKWDSTAYLDDQGAQPYDKIWYARSQGNDWVLVSSDKGYEDANVVIKASPNGEVCIGSGC